MARVIIVSRTRMANGYVCVGGVDVDFCRSVRLLTANGGHETAEDCPYEIWEIWNIDYHLNPRRPNPHTEDANVMRREKVDRVDILNLSINRFAGWLERARIPLFQGSLFSVFDGKLKRTDMDKLYISKEDVPAYSTCFWINDKRLLGYESRGRWQYRYNNMSNRYGYTISSVGAEKPLDTIEEGSLIRLSLAHWWKPEDSDDEERCYLQLSGCLIQGKPKEDKMPWEPQGDVPSVVDEKKDDMPSFEVAPQKQNQDWFDEYEQELDELLLEKANVEEKIKELRSQLLQQMEDRHLDKYTSTKYSVNYYPLKTILQFDRKTFKEENEELYSSYCVPKQKDASIVIRKNRNNSESQTI